MTMVLYLLFLLLQGIPAGQLPAHAPVALVSPVQDKNFYLLSQIERTPEVREAVQRQPVLASIGTLRVGALDKAARECVQDVDCYVKALRWSDEESKEAGRALAGLGHDTGGAHGNVVVSIKSTHPLAGDIRTRSPERRIVKGSGLT